MAGRPPVASIGIGTNELQISQADRMTIPHDDSSLSKLLKWSYLMPRTFSLQILLSCATLTFALGWLAPKALDSWRATKQEPPQQAASTEPTPASAQSGAVADALSRFKAIDWMDRFALSAKEYATYQAVQRELFGKTDGQ